MSYLHLAASLNAEPFYAAHGYEVRERSAVVLQNGHRMPAVWMRKSLAAPDPDTRTPAGPESPSS